MSNLLLTTECNQTCPFCFATAQTGEITDDKYLSVELFKKYLDYLDRSGMDSVRLLGGEPTIHPEFLSFVNMARERNKKINIFTNGLIPKRVIEVLSELNEDECRLLVNVTPNIEYSNTINQTKLNVIKKLNQISMISHTIYHSDIDQFDHLIDVIDETGCQRAIRLGIALPTDTGNAYIHPKHYKKIGTMLVDFIIKAHKENINFSFDCGFVYCMFSNEEITELESINSLPSWKCAPIIDIAPDDSAIHCFPLSHEIKINNALEYDENTLNKIFKNMLSLKRILGIYKECTQCKLRMVHGCSGGCLSLVNKRINYFDSTFEVPSDFFSHHL